jgi:hypothetical protein
LAASAATGLNVSAARRAAGASTFPIKFNNLFFMMTSNASPKGIRMTDSNLLKVLNSRGQRPVEKHHNGEMAPPSPVQTTAESVHERTNERKRRHGA